MHDDHRHSHHSARHLVRSDMRGQLMTNSADIDSAAAHTEADPANNQPNTPGGFNYGQLDPDAACTAREAATAIQNELRRSISTIGQYLRAVKDKLNHGQWLEWLDRAVGIKPRSAQNYMTIARFLTGKNANFAYLPSSVICALARAPVEIVSELEEEVANTGNLPSAQEITRRINVARAQERTPKLAPSQPSNETLQALKDGREWRDLQDGEDQEIERQPPPQDATGREDQLRAIAQRMATALGSDLHTLLAALGNEDDRTALQRLLAEAAA
jgi:hypothetical protein